MHVIVNQFIPNRLFTALPTNDHTIHIRLQNGPDYHKMANNNQASYLSVVYDKFSNVRKEDGTILVAEYVDAYEAIIVFFDYFGRLFSFITADVKSKIEILRKHLKGNAG